MCLNSFSVRTVLFVLGQSKAAPIPAGDKMKENPAAALRAKRTNRLRSRRPVYLKRRRVLPQETKWNKMHISAIAVLVNPSPSVPLGRRGSATPDTQGCNRLFQGKRTPETRNESRPPVQPVACTAPIRGYYRLNP